jgi:Rad3-related DNA helicase
MVDEALIHELFPHRDEHGGPRYRRHQFEVIRDGLEALEGGIEDLVIEAPTGAGKTSIAVTMARYETRGFPRVLSEAQQHYARTQNRDDAFTIMAPHQAHMITSMKMLQDAYLQDDVTIKLLKGKGNYDCRNPPQKTSMELMASSVNGRFDSFSCRDSHLLNGRLCEHCPYQRARSSAQWSPIALHNFDSFLNQVSMTYSEERSSPFIPRRLLTIDEGHNTEDKLASNVAMEFTPGQFKRLGLNWVSLTSDEEDTVTAWVRDYQGQVAKATDVFRQDLVDLRSKRIVTDEQTNRMRVAVKNVALGDDMTKKMKRYLESRGGSSPVPWVAEVDASSGSVRLEPIRASRFVRSALLRFGEKRVHLSATFLDANGVFRKSMNLKMEDSKYIQVPSTFPVENRRLVRRYVGDMGYRYRDKNLPSMLKRIQEIADENRGVRGLVHAGSYDMAKKLEAGLSDPRFVFHGREDRDRVTREFMSESRHNSILVGVAMTEGYDFKNDLCRFQIIAAMPYQYPSKRVKARQEIDPQHSDWRTCLTLVQMYGRVVRSAEDYGVTCILDSRFDKFLSRNRKQLPDWFLEACEEPDVDWE